MLEVGEIGHVRCISRLEWTDTVLELAFDRLKLVFECSFSTLGS